MTEERQVSEKEKEVFLWMELSDGPVWPMVLAEYIAKRGIDNLFELYE